MGWSTWRSTNRRTKMLLIPRFNRISSAGKSNLKTSYMLVSGLCATLELLQSYCLSWWYTDNCGQQTFDLASLMTEEVRCWQDILIKCLTFIWNYSNLITFQVLYKEWGTSEACSLVVQSKSHIVSSSAKQKIAATQYMVNPFSTSHLLSAWCY